MSITIVERAIVILADCLHRTRILHLSGYLQAFHLPEYMSNTLYTLIFPGTDRLHF